MLESGSSPDKQRKDLLDELTTRYLDLMSLHRYDGTRATMDDPTTAGSIEGVMMAYKDYDLTIIRAAIVGIQNQLESTRLALLQVREKGVIGHIFTVVTRSPIRLFSSHIGSVLCFR